MKFKEICPVWANIFKHYNEYNFNTKSQVKLNIFDETRCVIAEAWKWSPLYIRDCEDCVYFAYCFIFCINGENLVLDEDLLTLKQKEFVRHFKIHRVLVPVISSSGKSYTRARMGSV